MDGPLDAMVEEIKKLYEDNPKCFEIRWRCYAELARKNILKLGETIDIDLAGNKFDLPLPIYDSKVNL